MILPDYRIVLVEPLFEESIGFVARAMKNFGLKNLHLVNPIARLSDDGRSRGGHAQEILDSMTVNDSLSEALDGVDLSVGTTAQKALSASNLLRRHMTPRELGLVLSGQKGTVGIVFGREGTGLNTHELGLCDVTVTIPASAAYQTLNLSHAAAIIFYELHGTVSLASRDQLAGEAVKRTILHYLSESAYHSGMEEYKIGLTTRAFRNVLGRSAVRRREASLLAGVMSQISETLSRAKNSLERVQTDPPKAIWLSSAWDSESRLLKVECSPSSTSLLAGVRTTSW